MTGGYPTVFAEEQLERLIEDGVIVRILDEEPVVDDDPDAIADKTALQTTVDESVFDIDFADSFAEPHRLRNDATIRLPQADVGVVEAVVLQNQIRPTRLAIADPTPDVGDEIVIQGTRDPIIRPGGFEVALGGVRGESE